MLEVAASVHTVLRPQGPDCSTPISTLYHYLGQNLCTMSLLPSRCQIVVAKQTYARGQSCTVLVFSSEQQGTAGMSRRHATGWLVGSWNLERLRTASPAV